MVGVGITTAAELEAHPTTTLLLSTRGGTTQLTDSS